MWIRRLIPLFLAALAFPAAIVLQTQMIEAEKQRPPEYRDLLYLPSGEYTHFAAVGYRHFAADFLFLRAIQAFGASFARPQNLGQLWSYFDTITTLDKRFIAAYSFGNLVIGEEAGDLEKGLELLDKGIENNPGQYRLAFEAAFFSLWIMNDPEKAAHYIDLALLAPDCPSYIGRWKGFLNTQLGRYQAAFENYLRDYISYYNAGEELLMASQRRRLADSVSQWHMAVLRDKGIEYNEAHGAYPTVKDLEDEGAFRDVEWPAWSVVVQALDEAAARGSKLGETDDDIQRLIKSFMQTNWKVMPKDPTSNNLVFGGYLITPGIEPFYSDGTQNTAFCGREFQIALLYRKRIDQVNDRILKYRNEHDNVCPTDLTLINVELEEYVDPWGGKIYLNETKCKLETTSAAKFARAGKFISAQIEAAAPAGGDED